ncbi:MAG TPA: hypothetical protein VKN82_01530, partial [Desulfohalobiaceae bacterium]|nr:hypothetical protein [Desulfohalobiaceae bacterium]
MSNSIQEEFVLPPGPLPAPPPARRAYGVKTEEGFTKQNPDWSVCRCVSDSPLLCLTDPPTHHRGMG